MCSWLLLQQCPAYLVHLILMVQEIGGRWLYSTFFVGCCFQDLFNIICRIFIQFLPNFFSTYLVSIHVVHLLMRIDLNAAWKKLHFSHLYRSDFHMINYVLIAVYAFTWGILMWFSVSETQIPKYVNKSANFWEPLIWVEISPFLWKHICYDLSAFIWRPMPPAACSRLCSRDLALVGTFARSTMSFVLSASIIISSEYRLVLSFFLILYYIYWCLNYIVKVCVSIWWENFYFHVFIENHYGYNSFFGETMDKKYLFHLPSVYWVKFLGVIYKKECHLEVFALTLSLIWWIVRICDVVDLLPWKLFWSFLKFFSISRSMQLSWRAL